MSIAPIDLLGSGDPRESIELDLLGRVITIRTLRELPKSGLVEKLRNFYGLDVQYYSMILYNFKNN